MCIRDRFKYLSTCEVSPHELLSTSGVRTLNLDELLLCGFDSVGKVVEIFGFLPSDCKVRHSSKCVFSRALRG